MLHSTSHSITHSSHSPSHSTSSIPPHHTLLTIHFALFPIPQSSYSPTLHFLAQLLTHSPPPLLFFVPFHVPPFLPVSTHSSSTHFALFTFLNLHVLSRFTPYLIQSLTACSHSSSNSTFPHSSITHYSPIDDADEMNNPEADPEDEDGARKDQTHQLELTH